MKFSPQVNAFSSFFFFFFFPLEGDFDQIQYNCIQLCEQLNHLPRLSLKESKSISQTFLRLS